jgi:bacteriocin-like protein
MQDTKKKVERKKLKEVNEQELQRVVGGLASCGECLCGSGSGSATSSSSDIGCVC